jgi:asparagine synthase (glutamine-hydrolysing)
MPRAVVEEGQMFADLDRALEVALRPWRDTSASLTVLFSGGVDSGLLAWELRTGRGRELLTIGVPGANDLAAARDGAAHLGLHVRIVEVDPTEVAEVARRWAPMLDEVSPVQRSVLVAFAVALGHTPPGPVLCGQGADELFLGYAHYRGLGPLEADTRSAADLGRLIDEDGPRVDRIAAELGRTLASPYLAPEFIAAATAIPIEARMPTDRPKDLFRRWAAHRGLPPGVADRPKRAMQYGSGIARLLARTENPSPSAGPPSR